MTVLERVEVVVDADSPVDAALVRQGSRDILVLSPHPSFEVASANVAELLRIPPDVAARLVREHLPDATRMSALLGVQDTIGAYVPLHADPPKTPIPGWGRTAILGFAVAAVVLPGVGVFAASTMDDPVPASKPSTATSAVTSGDAEVSTEWRCKPRMDIKQVRCTSPDGATWKGVFTVSPAISVTMAPSADTSAVIDPVTGRLAGPSPSVSPQVGTPMTATPAPSVTQSNPAPSVSTQPRSGSAITPPEKTLPMPAVRAQIESVLRKSLAKLLGQAVPADTRTSPIGPRPTARSATLLSVKVEVDLGDMKLPEAPVKGDDSGSELPIEREQDVTPSSKGSTPSKPAPEVEPKPAEKPAPEPAPSPVPDPSPASPMPTPTPTPTPTPDPPPTGGGSSSNSESPGNTPEAESLPSSVVDGVVGGLNDLIFGLTRGA